MWRKGQMSSALLSLMLTTSVVTLPPAGATPGYDAGPTPSPAAPQPTSAPQLNWGTCSQVIKAPGDVPSAQCGVVNVPVDYANPAGAQVNIAVIRIPATGPRIGALLVNPGGPGASAVDMVAAMGRQLAGSDISRRFDLVGFDPRGVGHSTPGVHCQTDAEFDAFRRDPMVDYSPAGVAHIEQVYRQIAQRCVARNGTAFLENVGTASAARDMDAVRQALGDQQINYLGYSYGTELGTAYVEKFGDHVRAMVLDGAIDPAIGPVDELINQEAGFQTAFNDYAADCAKSQDCPLGTDPNQWVARYHQLIDPLVTKPAATSEGRVLGYSDAMTGTINSLYTPQFWKFLTSGLLGLRRGTDPGDLLTLADEYYGRDPKGHYNSSQDAFNAIRCVDAPEPNDPASWADTDRRIREVAPFTSFGQFTGHAPRDLCALWPVPATSTPHPADPVAPGKVVVVSTTHDPATPYQAGVNLAHQLGADLITFEGTQHTVTFNGNDCVDGAVTRYLVDGTPPGNLRC
jgi:pimeloyl-ACP methyl ester carboxylesterase